jgi:beta-lactamase class D
MKIIICIFIINFLLHQNLFAEGSNLENSIHDAMKKYKGTCVFLNCKSDDKIIHDTSLSAIRTTPCSTFKIWNTLIGIECELISSPDENFYKWDGKKRFLEVWNKDQTLKEAFQVSCVPAYQTLARKIGNKNMQKWIDTIEYGDKNISSGIDDFWLPRDGKKSILITPEEQAQLIKNLVNGKLPFSPKAQKVLKEIMLIEKTSKGSFYGKTGSGMNIDNNPKNDFGWFVGYFESNEKKYSFSCLIKGENLTGRNAKEIVESILKKSSLL